MNMLEAYLPAGEQAELYECSDFPFNFAFVEMYAPVTASKVSREVNDWLTYLPQGREANWVVRQSLFYTSLQWRDKMRRTTCTASAWQPRQLAHGQQGRVRPD